MSKPSNNANIADIAKTGGAFSVPRSAMRVSVSELTFKDNGPAAKSAPVKFIARSGEPISHPWWIEHFGGPVVHDFAGMMTAKKSIPIDYCHDDKEVMGFCNHFDASSGNLVASGAIVPFPKTNDRGTEVLFKAKEGVPYEASINFDGDGIEIEPVGDGESVQVNGKTFTGPGAVVRKWPLRGVAVCPYGADANTAAMFAAAEESNVTIIRKETYVSHSHSVNNSTYDTSAAVEETTQAGTQSQAEACPKCGACPCSCQADAANGGGDDTPALATEPGSTQTPEAAFAAGQKPDAGTRGRGDAGKLTQQTEATTQPAEVATATVDAGTEEKPAEAATQAAAVDADKPAEGTEAPAEVAKATVDAGTEKKPAEVPTGTVDAAKLAKPAPQAPATEGQRFLAAFGEKGGVYFAQGKTFAEAQGLFVADLQAQLTAKDAEIAGLKTRLSAVDRGDTRPVKFDAPGAKGPESITTGGKTMSLEDKYGKNLATVAGAIKLPEPKK